MLDLHGPAGTGPTLKAPAPLRRRRIPLPAPQGPVPGVFSCEPWGGLAAAGTALVAAAHGTSSPAGQAAIGALVRAVAARRPDLDVVEAFVDVQEPAVPAVLAGLEGPARIVPLLLSAGYHVHVDLADAAAARQDTTTGPALGPDIRLVRVLARRLREAGLRRRDRVVLACAGSTDARAVEDCGRTARMLGELIGRPVTAGFISAAQPALKAAVAAERAGIARRRFRARGARVVVASYLLAPGYFASLAAGCGADAVAPPLLVPGEEPPAELVDLVLDRFAG
ncbi:cobalamin biosynthesis protein CbiX [Arthrobacter sp. E918]|uniref:Cobalamin biosynthesis protein CbiX n=2 Tax=Arthrobacter mobilis TaxID=2724944 RepID=A0A7X6HA98_9MICC|nr:cobalamin biosynthesis protein CbiX [Arthrobacter mobilis]